MTGYRISEVAKISDITAKTIRFYEQENLLSEVSRKENNYRIYTNQNIEELKVIKYARTLGFSLKQIKTLIHDPDKLSEYLSELKEHTQKEIDSLKQTKQNLEDIEVDLKHSQCTCKNNAYCCNIFMSILKYQKKGGEKIKWFSKTVAVANASARIAPANNTNPGYRFLVCIRIFYTKNLKVEVTILPARLNHHSLSEAFCYSWQRIFTMIICIQLITSVQLLIGKKKSNAIRVRLR